MDKHTVLTQLRANAEQIRRRFSVKMLSVFGSVAREAAGQAGDVDVLVGFQQKAEFDLFTDLKFYLEDLLSANVDVVTEKTLRPQIRQAIERQTYPCRVMN